MKLEWKTVVDTIKGWAILYPSAQRSNAQEAFIAKEFYQEFYNVMSDDAFKRASRKVRRHCRFFPTIADIYAVRDEVVSEINRENAANRKALPEYTKEDTAQERENAAKRLKIIKEAIAGKRSFAEAERMIGALSGYAQR